jgi:acetate CoA/acetoacetate CoA-transferase beta subunit
MDAKEIIARRVTFELHDRTLVNLGIGLPTLVANCVPPGIRVAFQSESGIVGFGARPPEGMEDPYLTDAGGGFASALPGAWSFDSVTSFALIRGGHLDMTVLGGLQVDAGGRLADWMVPGRMVAGMGGAMDLVAGARRVIIAMQHAAPGEPKIVRELTLSATAVRRVTLVVTDMAVIEPTDDGWCCVSARRASRSRRSLPPPTRRCGSKAKFRRCDLSLHRLQRAADGEEQT